MALEQPVDNGAVLVKKRGGRKPGSKNKPKAVQVLRIDLKEAELANLRYCMTLAIAALEKAVSIRIGLNDSDNRVADLNKQRQQLEWDALNVLRGAL